MVLTIGQRLCCKCDTPRLQRADGTSDQHDLHHRRGSHVEVT